MAPPMQFDTTLKELYALHSDDEEIFLVYATATSQVQLLRGMPLSTKYAYQDRLQPIAGGNTQTSRVFTQLLPQSHAVIAGKMNLVMLDLDVPGSTSYIDGRPQEDIAEVFGHISPDQRPIVKFVGDVSDITLPSGAKIAVLRPADCLEHLNAAVPFPSHYRAHSKRELAISTLPTAPSVVIDAVLTADEAQDPDQRAREVTRMMSVVEQRPLPFVVKLPQAHAGLGTFIVRNDEERSHALAALHEEVDGMLRLLSDANSHLRPASLILQKMLPGSAMAVSMFLPKTGSPIITSVCDQQTDKDGHWGRTYIDYSQQPLLKAEYKAVSETIAQYMHEIGYHGPLGADVMTDADGQHLVVDINARVSGSHPLGFLKGHLSVVRGFNNAAVMAPCFDMSLGEFQKQFSAEIDDGRILILAWSTGRLDGGSSASLLVLAGEDVVVLKRLEEKVMVLRIAASSFTG